MKLAATVLRFLLAASLTTLFCLTGCIGASRDYSIGQDPATKLWTMHFNNQWMGGEVQGDVEIHGADGSSFVAHFGADGDVTSAERARITQELQGTIRMAQMEALLGQLAAAYAQSQGIPVPPAAAPPAPGAGAGATAPASQPASAPAH